MCLEYYGLDPCHCSSSPGLSWDGILKIELELELISNTDMYFFVEKEMLRGISCIAKRYNKTNNNNMKFYDDSKPSKYMMCLDTNNLYG